MGYKTPEQFKLSAALDLVRHLAEERLKQAKTELQAKPDSIHAGYWQREVDDATTVDHWCFVEQMRIDPD